MPTRSLLLALSLAAVAVPLPGQTAATPQAPQILLETVGPDGWRMRLGPTNLGSLLESEKGRALWQPGVLPLLGMWQQMVGEEAAFVASRDRLLGYGGRIRVGVWIDAESRHNEPQQVAFVFEGDARTDLTAMAADLRLLQTRLLPGQWGETEVAGSKLAVYTNGGDAMTAPVVEQDRLWIAVASTERLPAAVTLARALAASSTGKPPAPNTPALRIDVDLAAIVALTLAKEAKEEGAFLKAFGFESLGLLQFTVDTAGPQVRLELAQTFRSDDRGIFAAFLPSTAGVSVLQHAVPKGPGSWKVGHFDFRALYTAITNAIVASRERTEAELRAEIEKEIGIDLARDLLAHMSDEVLLLTSSLAGLDSPDEVTWAFAVRLRDEAKFEKGLSAALPHARPFLQREATEKVGDVEVHRYGGMAGYDLHLAVGNGVFALAGGRDAEQKIAALLTAAKAMPKDAPAPAVEPDVFASLKRYLPAGTNGLAVADIDSILAMPTEWWLMALEELLPLPRGAGADTPDQREAARELLAKHNLNTLRSATGFAERTWRWRLFW